MKFLRLCVKENAGEKKKVIFLTGRKKNLNEKIEKRQNVQHLETSSDAAKNTRKIQVKKIQFIFES